MITSERKAELQAKGYYIEDMGAEWGRGEDCWWDGMFRWMSNTTDAFQDYEPSDSEEAAWDCCDAYDREQV